MRYPTKEENNCLIDALEKSTNLVSSGKLVSELPELLPCPFCGGDGTHESDVKEYPGGSFTYYWVTCYNDNCSVEVITGSSHDSPQSAAESWNTRGK